MNKLRIIDAHMHVGRYWEFFASDCGTSGIIRLMNRLGIERAYSMHHLWLFGRQEEGFSASLIAYEESVGRIPFLAVHDPSDEKKSFDIIEKCVGREGFIGIKIHPSFHKIPADDPSYEPIWRFAEEHGLPIISHTWSDTYNPVQKLSQPKLFESFVEKHPSVSFVCGHSGGPGSGQEQAIELARKYPNVYLDIAGDVFFLDLIPRLVKNVGRERVIFGTDQPWIDPRCHLTRLLLADIDDSSRELILGKNALRVFEPHLLDKEDSC